MASGEDQKIISNRQKTNKKKSKNPKKSSNDDADDG